MKKDKIKIGIIGGSGFYELPGLKQARKVKVSTKYGKTSDVITVGKYNGEMVAFLPRHGCNHYLPPHKIPYKANILALRNLGVEYIFAFCAAGSLNSKIKPGDFVVLDQLVNFT
jgi:5'-methylthioadenosine phosphorylase